LRGHCFTRETTRHGNEDRRIATGIYRLSTFAPQIAAPAGFTFNQFLVLGDEPLLFHTGLRRMFPSIQAAVARIMPPDRLRWICFGHYEADECGAMNEWLAVAPLRYIDTPHIPHGWEAGVVYEEATSSFKSTAISAAAKCPLHILCAAVAVAGGVSGDR
jgi:hypothetical protein